jgi:ketol-acid reductoisomerase
MMDRLSNPAKIEAYKISEELKVLMRPLFRKHMDDILSGSFSQKMMEDWANDDKDLHTWRSDTEATTFEKSSASEAPLEEQVYFDQGLLMVAMVKAGVELAYESMTESGIIDASAYYESLHEVPLIANTIARKKLYEMNRVISDTAEYGCYLFDHACKPLIRDYVNSLGSEVIGRDFSSGNQVDNQELISVNTSIRNHDVERIGSVLRASMTAMKQL